MKHNLPYVFLIALIFTPIFLLFIFGPFGGITGLVVYNFSETNDTQIYIENATISKFESLDVVLYEVNESWENYSMAIIDLDYYYFDLLSSNSYNFSEAPFNISYNNATWNLSSKEIGYTNISIRLFNKTGTEFMKLIYINITQGDPVKVVGNGDMSLSHDGNDDYFHNGTNVTITLSNILEDWTNYTDVEIYYNSSLLYNYGSDTFDLSGLSSYQDINFSFLLKNFGEVVVHVNVSENTSYNVYYYNLSFGSYVYEECSDVIFRPDNYDQSLINRIYWEIMYINWSDSNYTYVTSDLKGLKSNNIFDPSLYVGYNYSYVQSLNKEDKLYEPISWFYKNNNTYCEKSFVLDWRPLYYDLFFNASFQDGILSCDNISSFYIIDTEFNMSDNSTKWNNFTFLNITFDNNDFSYNFSNSSYLVNLSYLRENNIDLINLTKEINLQCKRNNLLRYNLTYINSTGGIDFSNESIDLYYPTCSDLKLNSDSYNLNDLLFSIDIINNNSYDDDDINNEWFGFVSFNLSKNQGILDMVNKTYFDGNNFFVNSFNGLTKSLATNVTYNRSYGLLNDDVFYFDSYFETDYRNFSCILPLNFSDTTYPNISVEITPSIISNLDSGKSVTLFFNYTNIGYNASNFYSELFNGNEKQCELFISEQDLDFNKSIVKNYSFVVTKSMNLETVSRYNGINSHTSWIDEGKISISVKELDNIDSDSDDSSSSSSSGGSYVPTSSVESTEDTVIEEKSADEEKPKEVVEEPEEKKIDDEDSQKADEDVSKDKKVNNFLSKKLKRTTKIEYDNGKTIIKEKLKNPNILKQYDIFVTVIFPKEIVPNTDYIEGNFKIIEYDPVIQFYYEEIDSGKEIEFNYKINKTLTQNEIDQIITEIDSTYSKDDLNDLEKWANETSKNIDIKIDVKKDYENKTTINTILDPTKDLHDTKVYLEIPKCLAQHLSELEFERDDYEVIEEDPLIAWSFSELNTPQSLEFKTLKEVSEDCWEQIKVLPISKEIMEKLTKQTSWYIKFWPFLIIFLILMIAPFVSKHAELVKKPHHDGKHFLHKDILKELEFGVEEIALSSIILLNVMDFFEILPPDLDFVKKIISWSFLGLLIYNASVTKILFGVKHKYQDILLILGYFGLMLSDVLNAFNVLHTEIVEHGGHSFVAPFLNLILSYNNLILYAGFYIGLIIILILTILDFKKDIKEHSMLGLIHEVGVPSSIFKAIERFFLVFLAYFVFFIIFFKFFMEWFAVAVDAVIAVVGIFVYIMMFFKRHHKHYGEEHFVYKIGTIGEEFYDKFIELFSESKGFLYALSGMLVVHLLVDLSNFIIPYVISIHDSLYFMQLATDGILQNHTPLIPLLLEILPLNNLFLSLKVTIVYLLEFLAIITFLVMPAVIWYDLATNHKLKAHRIFNGLYLSSIVLFFTVPLFKIMPILEKSIVGVDLLLLNIFEVRYNFDIFLYIALGVGLVVGLLSINKLLNKIFMIIGVVFSQVFFIGYVSSYLYSWSMFLVDAIISMFGLGKYIIGATFFLFFVIILMFYFFGSLVYIYIIIKKWAFYKVVTHNKHVEMVRKIVDYIQVVGSVTKARENLLNAGWNEKYVHEGIINYLKADNLIKRFILVEKQHKVAKEKVVEILKNEGWDEVLINNEIKRYW